MLVLVFILIFIFVFIFLTLKVRFIIASPRELASRWNDQDTTRLRHDAASVASIGTTPSPAMCWGPRRWRVRARTIITPEFTRRGIDVDIYDADLDGNNHNIAVVFLWQAFNVDNVTDFDNL